MTHKFDVNIVCPSIKMGPTDYKAVKHVSTCINSNVKFFYFSPKNTFLVSNFHFYSYTLVFSTNLTFRACSEILRMNMKSLLKR